MDFSPPIHCLTPEVVPSCCWMWGEFAQLDVAYSMTPEQTTQSGAVFSTAPEARSTITFPRGRAGPSEKPQREARRPLARSGPPPAQFGLQGRRKPIISSLFASQTSDDQVTTSLQSSIAVSPSLLPSWDNGAEPASQDIPVSLSCSPVPARTICRWARRPGEDARRCSTSYSLVARECSLTRLRYSTFFNNKKRIQIPREDPRRWFFLAKFYSSVINIYIPRYSIAFLFPVDTGRNKQLFWP